MTTYCVGINQETDRLLIEMVGMKGKSKSQVANYAIKLLHGSIPADELEAHKKKQADLELMLIEASNVIKV